jgi:ankyrin repeat protein
MIVLFLFGCEQQEIDYDAMAAAQTELDEKMQKSFLMNMSVEEIFPDEGTRKLARAAGEGDLAKINELVSTGVDVNSTGSQGATPLFWSMQNFNGFEALLKLGANPNTRVGDSSIMYWLTQIEEVRFLEVALQYGGNPNLVAGRFEETPIFGTIGLEGASSIEAMLLLLKAGADINATSGGEPVFGLSNGGKTPLMRAADLVRFDIVLLLLEHGADYSKVDDSGLALIDRIQSVAGRFKPGSEQEVYLNQVISWLAERGVSVANAPIPEGNETASR